MPRSRLWLAILCVVGVACAESRDTEPDVEAEIERLEALGYVESSGSVADPSLSGAVVVDRSRVAPGYRLYCEPFECTATLIDVDGQVVHSWHSEEGTKWWQAELLPNGDLLVPEVVGNRRRIVRLGWNGEVEWEVAGPVHHDVEIAPSGEILSLTHAFRAGAAYRGGDRFMDNGIVRVSETGEVLDEISLMDIVETNRIGYVLEPAPEDPAGRGDPLHANSIESMRRPGLADRHPLYAAGNVLVGCRHARALYVIDLDARELVWAWGPGAITSTHDANVLDDGHVLLFDNGSDRGWSEIIEMDPVTGEIVRTYGAESGEDHFFSTARGSCQRLPNGNTLVAVSNEGEAFEVTSGGERVWRFYNPRLNEDGRRTVIVRMHWYPHDHPGIVAGLGS